jgi:hypothetical protein
MDWSFDLSRIRVLLQSSSRYRRISSFSICEGIALISLFPSNSSLDESRVSRVLEMVQVCYPQDDWQLLLYLSDLQVQMETSGKCKRLFVSV